MVNRVSRSSPLSAALAMIAGPAFAAAATNGVHLGGRGCGALVTQVHPDVHGRARKDEVQKCKADPDAYIKAAGL